MNEIAFPRKELFARITEPIQRSLRENLSKGAERELWEFLSRRSAGKFGVEIEIELKDIAQFLLKAFRTTYRAFKALVAKGFCKVNRTLSGYGYRVVLLVPKGCEVDQNCADTLPVLSHLGHSNPHSLVTSFKENLDLKQTGEFSLENSPLQKEGLRSPLPKPKPRSQDAESEPELTEALGLIAEYGNRTGDRNLETNPRIRKSITNSARNLSPEKLIERVRNAITVTEQTRLKGALRKPIEGLLSWAIAQKVTPNPLKAQAAAEDDQPFLENGAGRVYCAADWQHLGTFDHQPISLVSEVGHLINPPSEKNSELSEGIRGITPDPSDNSPKINPEFPDRNSESTLECQVNSPKSYPEFSEGISAVEAECQVIADPTPHEPTEDELSDAITYSRCYEERLGISPQDRPSAIQRLIGVNVSGLSKLTDLQRVQYYQALVHEPTSNTGKNH